MSQTAIPRPVVERRNMLAEIPGRNEAQSSGVSWPAVFGGAFVSAALGLILISLGTGLEFSSVSPWSSVGASASTIGKAAIAWLILTQIIASAMGGYLAGRLRTKWTNVHTDEVYFRDTAHGFLVWAVGLVITAALLASTATSLAGGAAQQAGNGVTSATATNEDLLNPNAYFVDTLLRSNGTTAERNDISERAAVETTLIHSLHEGTMATGDRAYLAQVVATRTGISPSDAEQRVSDVFAQAQQAADRTRKALTHLSLWLFVALLSGAFCASYAGTIGGKQRDHIPV
jgi:hypothetical protein